MRNKLGAIKDKERVTGNTAGAFLQCKKQTKPFHIHGKIVDDFYVSLPRHFEQILLALVSPINKS